MIESTLYNKDSFKDQFLKTDFDNYLIEQNNNLVNSNEHYLQYKNDYIKNTNDNYEKFIELLIKFNALSNNYNYNTVESKYSYTFIDHNIYSPINTELKRIIERQKKMFDDFINYIQFLNTSSR